MISPLVNEIHIVVDTENENLANLLVKNGIKITACPESRHGLGSSLACGIRATSQADGWIIFLGDMPFIKQTTIKNVLNALKKGHKIVTPIYNGHRGHPVGFDKSLYKQLINLSGDTGGKNIIQNNLDKTHPIIVDDPGIIQDIDSVEDLSFYYNNARFD